MKTEGDSDVAARVDGNDGVDIEDGLGIDVEYDVTIDFDARIALGVKIGFDEKTDRDEMVVVDVENEAGAWVGVVSAWTGVVTEIFVGVTLKGEPVREIIVEVGAYGIVVGAGVVEFVVEWVVAEVVAQTVVASGLTRCHS